MDWIKNNSQPFVEYLLLISVFSSYFSDKLSRSLNVVVACQVDNNNLCFYLQYPQTQKGKVLTLIQVYKNLSKKYGTDIHIYTGKS